MSELSKLLIEFIGNKDLSRNGAKMADLRGERLQIMLSPEELSVIDDFRFQNRMPTRAAAVRELLKFGLASVSAVSSDGSKSSSYGVLGRGPRGHLDDGNDSED